MVVRFRQPTNILASALAIMSDPEESWHGFEAMIEDFSDSETPNESATVEAVSPNWKDNDSDSELYFSDSAMSEEDSQLSIKLTFPKLRYQLTIRLFRD